MIGSSLLFRTVADWRGYGAKEADAAPVYLPKGTWVDYESLEWFDSKGGLTKNIPFFRRERVPTSEPKSTYYFMNPLFAREGAIIPRAFTDDKTMNVLGKRWGEKARNELRVRVFAGAEPSSFILYEDDGVSRSYLRGKVRETSISQQKEKGRVRVSIDASQGSYTAAPNSRANVVELVLRNERIKKTGVSINGKRVVECTPEQIQKFEQTETECWYQAPQSNLVRARTEILSVEEEKRLEFSFE
jgi:alpha-glucosidase